MHPKTPELPSAIQRLFLESVIHYLKQKGVDYQLLSQSDCHSENSTNTVTKATAHTLRAALFKDSLGMLMVVHAQDHVLDVKHLMHVLDRRLEPLHQNVIKGILLGCESGHCPPLPEIYGIDCVFDTSLKKSDVDTMLFPSGLAYQYVQIPYQAYFDLYPKAIFDKVSHARASLESAYHEEENSSVVQLSHKKLHDKIRKVSDLPAMPVIAEAIMNLRMDPNADAHDLATVVERDPALAAQVLSWARSAYYGYHGVLHSVEDAIVKVLGFDVVMNLALSIAIGKIMKVRYEGAIGLYHYWRNTIYCAVVVECLVKKIPPSQRPSRGLAYLSALMQDIGYLLMGQIFPQEFEMLNKMLTANPHIPVSLIEHATLGIGHEKIGAWLLEHWRLPEAILTAVREHHNPHYQGPEAVYPQLIFIAKALLHRFDVGDATSCEIPQALWDAVGLRHEDALAVVQDIMARQEELDLLISTLVR